MSGPLPFGKTSVCLILALSLSGCAILGLRKQDQLIAESGLVSLTVDNRLPRTPAYALLLGPDQKVLGAQECSADGLSSFAVPLAGTYQALAFADLNHNQRFDSGEPAAFRTGLQPVPLADPDTARRLHSMRLVPGAAPALVGLTVPAASGDALRIGLGEVASLSDKRFDPQTGTAGLWTPIDSLRAGNLGLYFTEPYDPSRIPVVFVHGIGGSPQDFAKLIPRLDHRRYQAWFFTYPSGFRLGKVSTALATLLDMEMQQKGIYRIHIVAHSMGGLVSRDAILKLSKMRGGSPVRQFVSISTPWGGHEAAAQGIRALKHPVPSWIDMAPGSAFLTRLWQQKLPAGTRHYLLCGFDTIRRPWLTLNNDTVVNLRSSFYPPAQDESRRIYALPLAHEAILFKTETAEKMNAYLAEP